MSATISALSWLEAFPEEDRTRLLSQSSLRKLRLGETLDSQDQALVFLRTGQIALTEASGASTRLNEHTSWFTTPLFMSGSSSTIRQARAESDCELLILARPAFKKALRELVESLPKSPGLDVAQRRTIVIASALDASLQGQTTLATRADVAITLQQVQDSSEVSFSTLADVLGRDPTVVATLMHSANSNLFGGMDPVRTLPQAIARLGLRATRNLALSVSIFNLYKARDPKIRRALHRVWSESVEIAALAYQLARGVTGVDEDLAMLAGLLHRIGALPLLQLVDQRRLACSEEDLHFMLAATESLEGLRLAEHWQQDEPIISTVVSHTWEERSRTTCDCSDIVHLARLIRAIEMGGTDSHSPPSAQRWRRVAGQVNPAHLPVALQSAAAAALATNGPSSTSDMGVSL